MVLYTNMPFFRETTGTLAVILDDWDLLYLFIYLLSQLKWTLGVFSFGCSESRCCEHGWAGISLSLVLSSLGCVHRRGIAGSDGDSMFNF